VDTSDLPVADDDAWVAELLDALLVRETPISAVNALVDALKVRMTRLAKQFSAPLVSCLVFDDERFIVSGF
jgi:predicted RNA methylase